MAARIVPQTNVELGFLARFSSRKIESSHDTLSAASNSRDEEMPARRRKSRGSDASAGAAAFSINFFNFGEGSLFFRFEVDGSFVDIVSQRPFRSPVLRCPGSLSWSIRWGSVCSSGAIRCSIRVRPSVFAGYFPEGRGLSSALWRYETTFVFSQATVLRFRAFVCALAVRNGLCVLAGYFPEVQGASVSCSV